MINEFMKIAPYIANSVKDKLAEGADDAEILKVVHVEIISYFEKQNNMFMQYLACNDDQRRFFAEVMYDAVKPAAAAIKQNMNPVYAAYVERTGKTGAKNFITNA